VSGLLLDTHVYLWHANADPRLPDQFISRINSNDGPVYLSVVSAWEIAIKVGLGKLELDMPLQDLIGSAMILRGIDLLHIAPADIEAYATQPFPRTNHRDPFDRMLITQAQVRDLTILTVDQVFASYKVRYFLPPR